MALLLRYMTNIPINSGYTKIFNIRKLICKSSNRYNRHHMHIGNFNHFALLW